MIREDELREAISDYLSGGSLADFNQWLAQHSWNMHQDSDPSVQRLVGDVELAIAEYGYHSLSSADFRQRLRGLLNDNYIDAAVDVSSISKAIFSSRSQEFRLPRLQAEFAS